MILSQNIDVFRFEGYQPNWIHICRSDSIPNDFQTLQPDNFSNGGGVPVIYNGKIYQLMNVIKEYYDGYLIEAIDLQTGKEVWEDLYYTNERFKRRYAQTPEIQNDTLNLIVYTENSPKDWNFWPIWIKANLNKIGFNPETGNINYKSDNQPVDTAPIKVNMPEHLYLQNSNFVRSYCEADNFKYIGYFFTNSRIDSQTNVQIVSATFSSKEELIDSVYENIRFPYLFGYARIYDLNNKQILLAVRTSTRDESKSDFSYVIFDRKMNVLQYTSLSNQLDTADAHAVIYSDSNSLIVGSFIQVPYLNYLPYMPQKLFWFGIKGNLMQEVDISSMYSPDQFPGINTTLVFEDGIQKILMSVSYLKDGHRYFDFYKIENNGKVILTKTIKLDDPDKYLGIVYMTTYGEDLLCQFSYRDIPNSPPNSRNFIAWASFPLKDVVTGTKDETAEILSDLVYPNPANDYISFRGLSFLPTHCAISNQLGQIVSTLPVFHNKVNIAQLNAGMYFIKWFGKNMESVSIPFIKN